ncbi:sensor histidine kinase [Polymorphobacter sp. PAMC 29334]|uniref:sensor histidine kinase n=1 Tax=Polymorphobacter sp. PAMC 29334 TaxID=2862331 RepID=UPI001C6661BF|nr:ATP-binding protein [Polymorphobacter sp. PAMC 29334]QYE35798.1 sensor histidine kinase [Polymorphobacter sp. PAMC 29334]
MTRDIGGDTPNRSFSLAPRILAVNVFAILVLTGSIFYLDSFRERLLDQRRAEMRMQAVLIASFMAGAPPAALPAIAARYGRVGALRLRVYDRDGALAADSWRATGPTFELRDPADDPFRRDVARFLDQVVEAVGSFPKIVGYAEPAVDNRAAWAEVAAAAVTGRPADTMRAAPDRIVIISAAAPLFGTAEAPENAPFATVQLTRDSRDITSLVRAERLSSFYVFLFVLAASLLLSNYLASTIVRPLRQLALAAQRVRLGRARDVTVPRFNQRRDEIGQLARALSDMTLTLRERIDATEAFAADVAHEIKNPLASLSSAVDTFGRVREPRLQSQLLEVIRTDVGRIDRLITDIADASRLDAELSRSRYERFDLGTQVERLVDGYSSAPLPRGVSVAYAGPGETAIVYGDNARLAQVARNLIDNAVSFSPPGGIVAVAVTRSARHVELRVDDNGPGIPHENRDDIFRRFYSERPAAEDFGRHSGLGLSISRTIVEAHDGSIVAANRTGGGARFTVTLPVA